MEILVDGEPWTEPVSGDTAFDIFLVLRDRLQSEGRAILVLAVNGERVPAEKVKEELGALPTASLHRVEVGTERLLTLVERSLREMHEVLPELAVACHKLAEVFHSQNPQEGFEPFEEFSMIWQHIKEREQMITHILDLSPHAVAVKDKTMAEHTEALKAVLTQALDAMGKNDCIVLGDLLAYELAPLAEQEVEIVEQLLQHATSRLG